MNDAFDQIKDNVADLKAEYLKVIDLYERGKAIPALESIKEIYNKLFDLVNSLASDYKSVLLERRLKGHTEVQENIQFLIQNDKTNPEAILKIILTAESHIRSMEKEIKRNYPAVPIWIRFFQRYKKPIGLVTAGLFILFLSYRFYQRYEANKHGLVGHYFRGEQFNHLIRKRINHVINANWGRHAPLKGMPQDHFSIRWEGFLEIPEAGLYNIHTQTDDGVRLWLGPSLVIDDWVDHPVTDNGVQLNLEAGYYPIRLEYFDFNDLASVKLLWRRKKGARLEVIPRRFLVTKEKYLAKHKPLWTDFLPTTQP